MTLHVIVSPQYNFNYFSTDNYTFVDGTNSSVSMNIESQSRRSFADNTNPINYGLEPGDIVFAVFGSILLTIVCGLIILGYFIHPFFLA